MLTDEKRKKLLAGALAVVMLTGVAGCGNDKDSEWKNDNSAQNNQDEKKDEDNGGGFFHGCSSRSANFYHLVAFLWQTCQRFAAWREPLGALLASPRHLQPLVCLSEGTPS